MFLGPSLGPKQTNPTQRPKTPIRPLMKINKLQNKHKKVKILIIKYKMPIRHTLETSFLKVYFFAFNSILLYTFFL
jgi:hypothetical protein